jgi:23S rRNA (pseudouridine1915-N3)-methyltransferase
VTVTLLVVGRVRSVLAEAVAEYEGRLRHYWKFEVIEVDAGSARGRADGASVMAEEGERILSRIPDGSLVCLLDREGREMSSRKLSLWLQEMTLHGGQGVTFVIGGAFGVSPEVKARAQRKLSFSPMTFPHEMARLMLAEQLYRAGTILRNEPYHKGP